MNKDFSHRGNFNKAFEQLKNDKNNVVAELINNETFLQVNNKSAIANVVYTLKDNFATKNWKTQASSKTLENFFPGYNSTVYKKLNYNNAKLVAKVHADEFGLGGTGTYSAFGIIKHPNDSSRLAGGSSSGSAVSMHYDIGFSIGSDTGDSVRNPAGFNGFVGFKPTYGAISRYGLFAYASSLDTVAFFSKSVYDSYLLSKVLFGKDQNDLTSIEVNLENEAINTKPKKVLFFKNTEGLSKFVKQQYQKLFLKLKEENIEVEEVIFDEEILNEIKSIYEIISYAEAVSNLANIRGLQFGKKIEGKNWEEIIRNHRSSYFGDMVQRRLTLGNFYLNAENINELFIASLKTRNKIVKYFQNYLNEFDLLVYPSSQDVSPKIDEKITPNFFQWILTRANLSGEPSIVIPWIKNNNLPIGLALDAKFGMDQKLLNFALYFEELLKEKNE